MKKIGTVLGCFFCAFLLAIGVLFSFQLSFQTENLERILFQTEDYTSLKHEQTVLVNDCFDDVSLPVSIDDAFWDDEKIEQAIREMFEHSVSFDVTAELSTKVQDAYHQNEWEINEEEIALLCESINARCVSKFNNHLGVLLNELAGKVLEKIPWMPCLIAAAFLLAVVAVCNPVRIISAIAADGLLFAAGAFLLHLPVIKRLTIGYGVQSAYLLFQTCIQDFSFYLMLLGIVSIALAGIMACVVLLVRNNQRKLKS